MTNQMREADRDNDLIRRGDVTAIPLLGMTVTQIERAIRAIRAIPIAPQPVAVTVKPLVPDGLIDALRHQRQIDMDGTEVAVSRQACDEAADILSALAIQPADPLSDPRVKALVEAAQEQVEYLTLCGEDGDLLRNLDAALRAIGGEA